MTEPRISVVVGAGSGMGLAVAEALGQTGPLVVADRNLDAVTALAARLGPSVTAAAVDVTDQAQVDALVKQVSSLGSLGSLVVTAGLSPGMGPGRSIYEVNLIGMARLLKAFDPAVGEGSVAVCLASIAAHQGKPNEEQLAALDGPLAPAFFDRLAKAGVDIEEPQSAYVMSKVGVTRLVRHLAPSWGTRGGRILSLSPGVIDTPMGQSELEKLPFIADFYALAAVPRMGRATEIASVVAFLCSSGASYMTGTDVLVDGGAMLVGVPIPDMAG